ncbi:MAG: ATP-binding cassette domain-containing protein, partial [Micromonosporaceae bacterium]
LTAVFAVAAASFVAQEVISPFQKALGELMARRVDGEVFQEVIARSTGPHGVGLLEDQRALGDLRLAARDLEPGLYSPGQACAGILALIARYTQLVGFAAVVGVAFSWVAAVGVLGAVVLFRNGRRRGFRRFLRIWLSLEAADRKLNYFRQLGIEAPGGKEIRVFGLARWLRDRLYDVHLSVLRPLWAERRKIYLWPFFWYATAGLAVAAAVFGMIGVSASGALTLTDFALVMQAALGALRLSDHYPEIDTPTAVGVNAHDAVTRFLARADAEPSVAAVPPVAPSGRAAIPDPTGEIHVKDVSFRYPGAERAVFDGLELRIPARKCTAIVGLNGAGKTTLVKLLARLYEPSAG